ncbi:hypothetical protein HanPSC8_Chr14g0631441 [Helianthus annuus]|nr:hypothetical protein HanPSC8_Chr14g0631441 [Helianthus annuus]
MIGFKSFLIQTDKTEVQHQIVIFVGMTCGIMMLLFTRFWGEWALTDIMKNLEFWLLELFEDGVKMLLCAREVFVCNWLGNEHWFEYTRLCVVDQVWAVIGVSR